MQVQLPQNVTRKYRIREVPENELHEETVLVFNKTDGTKKGATGLFEITKKKAKGKFYDVTLPRDRGQIRLAEKDVLKLGLIRDPGLVDMDTGDDVNIGGF